MDTRIDYGDLISMEKAHTLGPGDVVMDGYKYHPDYVFEIRRTEHASTNGFMLTLTDTQGRTRTYHRLDSLIVIKKPAEGYTFAKALRVGDPVGKGLVWAIGPEGIHGGETAKNLTIHLRPYDVVPVPAKPKQSDMQQELAQATQDMEQALTTYTALAERVLRIKIALETLEKNS